MFMHCMAIYQLGMPFALFSVDFEGHALGTLPPRLSAPPRTRDQLGKCPLIVSWFIAPESCMLCRKKCIHKKIEYDATFISNF
jgi:hypothetical protein